MSVKDFFAFQSIKTLVIEYLKQKATVEQKQDRSNNDEPTIQSWDQLFNSRLRRPFRGYILEADSENYLCDGFNSIRCIFSPQAKEAFQKRYPSSIKIDAIHNMLICVSEYELESNHESLPEPLPERLNPILISLKINKLHVISFDTYSLQPKPTIDKEHQIQIYMSYYVHYLTRRFQQKSVSEPPMVHVKRIYEPDTPSKLHPHHSREELKSPNRQHGTSLFTSKPKSSDQAMDVEVEIRDEEGKASGQNKEWQPLRKCEEEVMEGYCSCDTLGEEMEEEERTVGQGVLLRESMVELYGEKKESEGGRVEQAVEDDDEFDELDDQLEEALAETEKSEAVRDESPEKAEFKCRVSQEVSSVRESQLEPSLLQTILEDQENSKLEAIPEQPEPTTSNNQTTSGQQSRNQTVDDILEKAAPSSLAAKDNSYHTVSEKISNSSSVEVNEKMRKDFEDEKNKDRIDMEEAIENSLPELCQRIGFGNNYQTEQAELIKLRRQNTKQQNFILSQEDLLDMVDAHHLQYSEQKTKKQFSMNSEDISNGSDQVGQTESQQPKPKDLRKRDIKAEMKESKQEKKMSEGSSNYQKKQKQKKNKSSDKVDSPLNEEGKAEKVSINNYQTYLKWKSEHNVEIEQRKKEKEIEEKEVQAVPMKRKQPEPKKSPAKKQINPEIPVAKTPSKSDDDIVKRGRGRPKKEKPVEEIEEPKVKRGRGRPKKEQVAQ